MRGSLSYRRGNCNVSWGEKLKVEGQKSKVRREVSGVDMDGI